MQQTDRRNGHGCMGHKVNVGLESQSILNYNDKKNSRKRVRWSAVPVAPKLMNVRCEGERGSGLERANDLCWAKI